MFLGKTLKSPNASLHPGVQMGTATLMLGQPCDGLESHPGGSGNIPSLFVLQKPRHLARMQTLPKGLKITPSDERENREDHEKEDKTVD